MGAVPDWVPLSIEGARTSGADQARTKTEHLEGQVGKLPLVTGFSGGR